MLIMKKNKQPTNRIKNATILFGYGLFAFIVVDVLISTVIPWTTILFNPHTNHLNVWVFTISLAAGVILPTLIAYILGDRATHVKNKASHHYNGVLFGVAAYWLSLIFSVVGGSLIEALPNNLPSTAMSAIVNGWPIVATTIVMGFVAFSYAHHQKNKTSVMEHAPYQWTLVGSVIAFFVIGIIIPVMTHAEMLLISFVPLVLTVVAVLISYTALRHLRSRHLRVMSAVTATTFGLVALSVATRIAADIFYVGVSIVPTIVAIAFGLAVWIGYLVVVARRP